MRRIIVARNSVVADELSLYTCLDCAHEYNIVQCLAVERIFFASRYSTFVVSPYYLRVVPGGGLNPWKIRLNQEPQPGGATNSVEFRN